MKKRTITVITAILLVLSFAGAGFGAWHFSLSNDTDNNVRLAYDDIAENYSFTEASKKRNTSKEYTIYLFPSTLYLNDYVDYLDAVSNIKPEELYGYVQPVTDDDGNIVYQDGMVKYETVYSGVKTITDAGEYFKDIYSAADDCGGDGGYINNVINSANGYEDLYLTYDPNKDYAQDYDTAYTDDTKTQSYWVKDSQGNNLVLNYIDANGNYKDANGNKLAVPKMFIGSYQGDKDIALRASWFNKKGHMYRNQHRYDRFGAWRTLEYGAGRYLPLKITVGANFAYSDFAKLVLSTLSSMPDGDTNDSFTMTFTHWSYVDMKSGESYKLPYYAAAENTKPIAATTSGTSTKRGFSTAQLRVRNAYLGYMLEQYFDIMQDFEKYSDEYGVIRLFPTFSSGSNHVQSSEFIGEGNNWEDGIDRGTGDGIYFYSLSSNGNAGTSGFTVNEPINDYRLHSTMTTHIEKNYVNDATGKTTDTVRCSMYANLNIDTLDKLEIWLKPKSGATTRWDSEDLLLYDISSDVLAEIKDSYGDGLYNLYLFIGDLGLSTNKTLNGDNMQSISNIVDVAKTSSTVFPSLTGKNLISLESFGATNLNTFNLEADTTGGTNVYDKMSIVKPASGTTCSINGESFDWPRASSKFKENNIWSQFLGPKGIGNNSGTSKYYRPVMIAIEKVRDARVLLNLKVDESESATNAVKPLQDGYANSSAFRMISENVYPTDLKSSTVDMTEALNDRYPYSYFISGVDFTGAANDYFQIRFQKRYRADLPFSGTDGTATIDEETTPTTKSGGGLSPAMDIIYNPEAGGLFGEDKRFVNAFGSKGFFSAVTAHMSGFTAPTAEYQVFFKLQNEEMRGIYDFILIYVPYEFWSVSETVDDQTKTKVHYDKSEALADEANGGKLYTHKAGFYMYAYRHTNIFLKVVEKNPSDYTVGTYGEMFIKHDDYNNNRLLFESVFQLGIKLTVNHETQKLGMGNSDINLGDDYTVPGNNATFAKCINTWTQAYIDNNTVDINRIVLRDHITKGIIGYYRKADGEGDVNNRVTVKSGDTTEYYELVLEELVVRKNYIFYMDTVRDLSE